VGDVCVTSPGRFGVCDDVSVFLEKKEVSRMNEQKSLLLEIAEAVDRRLRQHTPRDEGPPPEARHPRWLRWLGRQMAPNVGTLLWVGMSRQAANHPHVRRSGVWITKHTKGAQNARRACVVLALSRRVGTVNGL